MTAINGWYSFMAVKIKEIVEKNNLNCLKDKVSGL